MTLVELLVVISIMVMLVAVSVPMFKPMLESQRSAGGARAVSLALQRARTKAVYEKRAYGIEFMRFQDGNTPNVSLQMRLMRTGYNLVKLDTDNQVRVRVDNGDIVIYRFNSGSWAWNVDNDYWTTWDDKVKPGYAIQFGRQGRYYKLDSGNNRKLASPYANLSLPEIDLGGGTTAHSAVEINVLQTPRTTLTPVVVLPHGSVVDLQFSSFDNYYEPYDLDASSPTLNTNNNFRTFSSFSSNSGGVGVMFSPAGHIDRCYYFDSGGSYQEFKPHGGLFYFCIGEWDRQGTSDAGATLAEDGRNNLMTPSNFWVTVNPRNGQVRVAEMGAIPARVRSEWNNATTDADRATVLRKMQAPARKYASDHYTNIGGF